MDRIEELSENLMRVLLPDNDSEYSMGGSHDEPRRDLVELIRLVVRDELGKSSGGRRMSTEADQTGLRRPNQICTCKTASARDWTVKYLRTFAGSDFFRFYCEGCNNSAPCVDLRKEDVPCICTDLASVELPWSFDHLVDGTYATCYDCSGWGLVR